MKGIYHVNVGNIVTQRELVASVKRISEAYKLPVIALLMEGFGSMCAAFTLTQAPSKSTTTALDCLKNCGWSSPDHGRGQPLLHRRTEHVLKLPSTPLLRSRYHRCKTKNKKTYPHHQSETPWQRLQALPHYAMHLKPGITTENLAHRASAIGDNDAAKWVQQSSKLLFLSINRRSKTAA